VIAFGRWQGVRSLIGLAVSFAVILGFVIPAILRGRSPTTVALVGAMAIMLARSTSPTASAARPPPPASAPRSPYC